MEKIMNIPLRVQVTSDGCGSCSRYYRHFLFWLATQRIFSTPDPPLSSDSSISINSVKVLLIKGLLNFLCFGLAPEKGGTPLALG